jgi:hypothetical protein
MLAVRSRRLVSRSALWAYSCRNTPAAKLAFWFCGSASRSALWRLTTISEARGQLAWLATFTVGSGPS